MLVWGRRGREFKSPQPDDELAFQCGSKPHHSCNSNSWSPGRRQFLHPRHWGINCASRRSDATGILASNTLGRKFFHTLRSFRKISDASKLATVCDSGGSPRPPANRVDGDYANIVRRASDSHDPTHEYEIGELTSLTSTQLLEYPFQLIGPRVGVPQATLRTTLMAECAEPRIEAQGQQRLCRLRVRSLE